jgi:mannose-6-phosphate isomerase
MKHNALPLSPALIASPQWQTLTGMSDRLRIWAVDFALPLWAKTGRDAIQGGFHEKIDQDGQALDLPRRGRVTPRQLYCFAVAGELGWDGPWRAIIETELETYLARFFRPDGLIRNLVAADGGALDEGPSLYDQAFGLFALASLHGRVPVRFALEDKAKALLASLKARQGHDLGGFEETVPPSLPLQSNPHMHLFEACLAWTAVSRDPVWQAEADALAALCLNYFMDAKTGAVREYFDADWRPMPGLEGRKWEPGHQFEWGWLLMGWGQAKNRPDATAAAQRMIDLAEAHGVDPGRGVAVNVVLEDLQILDAGARLWPQTERLKAGLRRAQITGKPADLDGAVGAAETLIRYLDVPVTGLWLDRMTEKGDFIPEAAPASSFYHILCAVLELHRAMSSAA